MIFFARVRLPVIAKNAKVSYCRDSRFPGKQNNKNQSQKQKHKPTKHTNNQNETQQKTQRKRPGNLVDLMVVFCHLALIRILCETEPGRG